MEMSSCLQGSCKGSKKGVALSFMEKSMNQALANPSVPLSRQKERWGLSWMGTPSAEPWYACKPMWEPPMAWSIQSTLSSQTDAFILCAFFCLSSATSSASSAFKVWSSRVT